MSSLSGMAATIVFADGVVRLDGYLERDAPEIKNSPMAAQMHAVQFDGATGHIEWVLSALPNAPIQNLDFVADLLQPILERKQAAEDAALQAAEVPSDGGEGGA